MECNPVPKAVATLHCQPQQSGAQKERRLQELTKAARHMLEALQNSREQHACFDVPDGVLEDIEAYRQQERR